MLMVSRDRFDAHFIEDALETGHGNVQLFEGVDVRHVEETETGVIVHTGNKQEPFYGKYLIAADGVLSPTARSLGLNHPHSIGFAVDAEIHVTADVYEAEKNRATFNLFCVPSGYGWIFPKNGYLSCGVGSWRGKTNLMQHMQSFLAESFPDGSILSIKQYGHGVPVFPGYRQIATRRVCLVGDAAHLVDPIVGEGIQYAIKSGAIAAQVIQNLLQNLSGEPRFETRYIVDVRLSSEAVAALFDTHRDCRVYQVLARRSIGFKLEITRLTGELFFEDSQGFYQKFCNSVK